MGTGVVVAIDIEERRKRYAAALLNLSAFFPEQCEAKQKQLYFQKLIAIAKHPDDVDAAFQRVIDSRQSKKFPSWAEIEDRLRMVALDNNQSVASSAPIDNSEEAIAAKLEIFRTARALSFPDKRKSDPRHKRSGGRTPLATRPKDLPPLTAADLALMNKLNTTGGA